MMARFLFENPRILFLTVCVIVGAGLSSIWVMPRLEDPILGKRVAVISTVFPGADARRVESLVWLVACASVDEAHAYRHLADVTELP